MRVRRRRLTTVVGFVYHLYQGDLDVARVALERLREEPFGDDVALEDLSYGAVAVAQRLEELAPETLVLVAAAERGREAGTVERRELAAPTAAPAEVQRAVADAVTGYIHPDLVVEVAAGLGALPARAVAIELEPASVEPSETLTPAAAAALPRLLELVRAEVRS